MRLLVLSDLHVEIWRDFAPKFDIAVSRPDVAILAGDIYTKTHAPAWAAGISPNIPILYARAATSFTVAP